MAGQFKINVDTVGEKDWILLDIVQADARVRFAELGRRSGLSAPAAAERLRRLEDSGLIRGYHAHLGIDRLGLSMLVFIEISVKRADYPRFQKAISNLPWVLECHHIDGNKAFILKAGAPDPAGLELLLGYLSQFGETKTSLVLSTTLGRREFHNGSTVRGL
jgi:Lrp/AsnC family transcriptional regulator, leucine-responsive regulatory protein